MLICSCYNNPVFSQHVRAFVMMIISAERCCWHHYFLKETEGLAIFMFIKHPILSSQFFDVARNHWTVKSWEEIHISQKIYFCSIKKEYNIGVELSAYETGHMERPIVKTAMGTLPKYFVQWLSPFTAYLINKGLQRLPFFEKETDFGEVSQVGRVTCVVNTVTVLPSQVWWIAARF